jgi:hypothetical protein
LDFGHFLHLALFWFSLEYPSSPFSLLFGHVVFGSDPCAFGIRIAIFLI